MFRLSLNETRAKVREQFVSDVTRVLIISLADARLRSPRIEDPIKPNTKIEETRGKSRENFWLQNIVTESSQLIEVPPTRILLS